LKVGLPQALLHYKYYHLWETFFNELGVETVLSPASNKQILNAGVKSAPSEICLPVKIFLGHVKALKDVDKIFVPRVVSVEKGAYTCPKILGLPDIVRGTEGLPPVLAPTIDFTKGKIHFAKAIYNLGAQFSSSPLKIFKAYQAGTKALKRHELKKQEDGLSKTGGLKIGIVSHPYNIYDSFISLDLLKKIKKEDVSIQTSESLDKKIIEDETSSLPKELFWTYEKEVVGTALHWLKTGKVDGIIYLLSFACGPDSLAQVLIEDFAQQYQDVPLMSLVIDEHSAEAGLLTRLEAFLDMIKRRKKIESNHRPDGLSANYARGSVQAA